MYPAQAPPETRGHAIGDHPWNPDIDHPSSQDGERPASATIVGTLGRNGLLLSGDPRVRVILAAPGRDVPGFRRGRDLSRTQRCGRADSHPVVNACRQPRQRRRRTVSPVRWRPVHGRRRTAREPGTLTSMRRGSPCGSSPILPGQDRAGFTRIGRRGPYQPGSERASPRSLPTGAAGGRLPSPACTRSALQSHRGLGDLCGLAHCTDRPLEQFRLILGLSLIHI